MTRHVVALAGLLLLAGPEAFAQTEAPAPAHLSVVQGEVRIERGAAAETAGINMVLVSGDRLRTDQGRVEVLLGDGTAVHVDERSTFDLNSERVLQLLEGRIIVLVDDVSAGTLQIDASPASVRLLSAGEYRLSLFGDGRRIGLDIAVVRGEAEVTAGGEITFVQAGSMVSVGEGEAPTWPVPFNSARADAFVAWSEALTDSRRATQSTEYLPDDLQMYAGALDQSGTWGYQAQYGHVWYPTVGATWRPYHRGRWRWTIGLGWTWVGGAAWHWPTHHFGRWGLTPAGVWYWIPARIWSPAWVHWAVSPTHIGWCALGWNNRPVLGFWGHHRTARFNRHFGPWHGWSVLSTRHFRRGSWAHRTPVARTALLGSGAPRFVVQSAPPNVAVPRGALGAVARGPGATSVTPRNGRSRRGPEASSFAVRRGTGGEAPRGAAISRGGGTTGVAGGGSRAATRDGITVVGRGSDIAVRRGPGARSAPAAGARGGRLGEAGATRATPGVTRRAGALRRPASRGASPASRRPESSPGVIYHRGTPSSRSAPARAGRDAVAVPRTRTAPASGGRSQPASRAGAPSGARRGVQAPRGLARPGSSSAGTPGRGNSPSAAPTRRGGARAPSVGTARPRGGSVMRAPSGGGRPSVGRARPSAGRSAPSVGRSRPSPRSTPSVGPSRPSAGRSTPSVGRSRPSMSRPATSAGRSRPSVGRSAPSVGSSRPARSAPRARQAPSSRSSGTAVRRSRGGSRD